MRKQTGIRLPDITQRQLEALCKATGMNQSAVMVTAIDRMYREENRTMERNDEWLDVVETHNLSADGMIDLRLAHINDDWFVYRFNLRTAQVTHGDSFARHSASGIRYLFAPMTEQEARREFERRKANNA